MWRDRSTVESVDGSGWGPFFYLTRRPSTVPPTDPDTRPGPDADREAWVVEWVRRRIEPAPVLTHTETCLYTVAPDEDFVIDRVGPLVIASPCTGHGFKFAPLVGEVLADLATGVTPSVPLDRFRLDRPALRR